VNLNRDEQNLSRQPAEAGSQVAPSDHVLLAEIAHREGLLAQAQDLAEQLGSSNEELLLQIEELRAAMEELAAQNDELRAVQQEVEVERRRYQDLFEFLPDCYLATNLAGVIREANQAAAELLRVPAEWLAGKPLDIYIAREERPAFYARLAQWRQGETARGETRLVPRAGASFPATLQAVPLRNARGQLEGFLCLLRRAPESAQAQKESETLFRALAETTSAAILIVQGNKIRYSNLAAKSITGYAPADLLDMDFWELAHPDYRENLKQHGVASQWTDQVPARYELKLLTKEGEERWVDVTAGGIEFEGKPAQIVTAFDITERDRAERALRQAHGELELRVRQRTAELAEANESLRAGMAERKRTQDQVADIARFPAENPYPVMRLSEQGVLLYANEASQTLLCDWDCQVGDLAPLYWRDLAAQAFASLAQKTAQVECGERVYSFVVAPILDAGYVNLYGRDVTEHMQVEQTLRQKTLELQARNEELAAYAHTVAHDLKNPVTQVVSYAELLESDYAALSEEERQQSLQVISHSAHKLGKIVDALLLLASVRLQDVPMGQLDMQRIVAEVVQRLSPFIEEYPGELVWPSEWPAALGYAPWVEEVWVNYLSNAIKYGGRPPRVELGADPLPREAREDPLCIPPASGGGREGGDVRFWVRDNGQGLTPEEQARLFAPFTRLDRAQAAGYGLGLSIVRRIVERLGGQVGVESQPGHGSTFFFTLPGAL
jgi:PAS domain S-box-containing protein